MTDVNNTAISLIDALKWAIYKSGSENTEVVIRHSSEHEFGPEDDLRDFCVYYDEKAKKCVISVTN